MSILDDGNHRTRWAADARHIVAELLDLQHTIDIAMAQAPHRSAMHLLVEADTHLDECIKNLDIAVNRVMRIR